MRCRKEFMINKRGATGVGKCESKKPICHGNFCYEKIIEVLLSDNAIKFQSIDSSPSRNVFNPNHLSISVTSSDNSIHVVDDEDEILQGEIFAENVGHGSKIVHTSKSRHAAHYVNSTQKSYLDTK